MKEKYALNLAEDGRVLSVTFEKYALVGSVLVDSLPDGNLSDYRWQNDVFVLDPLPTPAPDPEPTQLDIIEAQVTYTAMMTDTLLS